ncbi:MAG: DNA recombination protein RmuC, partial [Tepidisphaeraceae bacterium]
VYLWMDRRCRAANASIQTGLGVAEGRCADLASQIAAERQQTEAVRAQVVAAEKSSATLGAQLQSAQANLAEQKRMLDEAQAKLTQAFASVSQEALAKNNEAFLQLAQERFKQLSTQASGTLDERKAQIEGQLKPLHELLNQYQSRLADVEKSRVESYSMLREQLGVLAETQRTLNTQTGQLVTALRRPTTRGQWGEITLRRLVELAGMSSRCDFCEQATVTDSDDARQRPDMVVNLPGGRQIVIDCKATLDAFLDAAAAPDEDNRRAHLLRHSQQVRARSRELAAKAYWNQFERSPEYVVMFLPGEAFLYAAVETDGTLIEDCLKNRVIVATPTTLIALLKAIEFGWRQEDMTANAERIRELGVELFDRIAILAGHVEKLGASINATVAGYNATVGSFETRVMVSARKMSELGAKSDKDLPDLAPLDSRPRELTVAAEGDA